jgi:hypothetical protein
MDMHASKAKKAAAMRVPEPCGAAMKTMKAGAGNPGGAAVKAMKAKKTDAMKAKKTNTMKTMKATQTMSKPGVQTWKPNKNSKWFAYKYL